MYTLVTPNFYFRWLQMTIYHWWHFCHVFEFKSSDCRQRHEALTSQTDQAFLSIRCPRCCCSDQPGRETPHRTTVWVAAIEQLLWGFTLRQKSQRHSSRWERTAQRGPLSPYSKVTTSLTLHLASSSQSALVERDMIIFITHYFALNITSLQY